jgi:hypothetical protein
MHLKPPHVPPAVQLAQAGIQGPRVLPGKYTIRIEDNGKSVSTPLTVGLDQRVKWSVADRQAQFAAAMKVYALFNDESAVFGRIAALREQVATASKGRPAGDAVAHQLASFDGKLDALRKRIVATSEGGAITGEERLREHTDQLYGAILSWEGAPSAYQLQNIAGLQSELGEIDAELARLTQKELPALNQTLKARGVEPLAVPSATARDDEEFTGGGRLADRFDPDKPHAAVLPRNLRLWN